MLFQREYIDLNTIYKEELVSDTYKINTISLTPSEVRMDMLRNARSGRSWLTNGLKSDFDYVRLIKHSGSFGEKGVMMSDTPMERNTNRGFIQKANGDVLIFGLGLGLIVFPLLNDDSVKSITVVELYQDLIDVVQPKIKEHDKSNKVTIVQGDCFTYEFPKGQKFDSIYFDIWLDITTDDYKEHKELSRKYRKNLNKENPNCFMDAWLNDFYKREIRREKRYGYGY